MGYLAKFIILVHVIFYIMVICPCSKSEEYCNPGHFSPSCPPGEVVIIREAEYGTLHVGKCIDDILIAMVGCVADELAFFDKKCSGKTSCAKFNPETEIDSRIPCLRSGFKPFLKAEYYCQTVLGELHTCVTPKKLAAKTTRQWLSSDTSRDTHCGLHSTPYVIEAMPGQTINITIMDFSWTNTNSCVNYGYVLDTTNDDVITICGHGIREKLLMVSSGNQVQILMDSSALRDNSFLLGFRALGCPEPAVPKHGWVQRKDTVVTMGCYSSDVTWTLQCVNNQWLGQVADCTPETTSTEKPIDIANVQVHDHPVPEMKSKITTNHVLVVTIGCITLISCSIVVIVGVYCIRRYQRLASQYSKDYTSMYPLSTGYDAATLPQQSVVPTYTLSRDCDALHLLNPPLPDRNTMRLA